MTLYAPIAMATALGRALGAVAANGFRQVAIDAVARLDRPALNDRRIEGRQRLRVDRGRELAFDHGAIEPRALIAVISCSFAGTSADRGL
jgi:hypothetical protein